MLKRLRELKDTKKPVIVGGCMAKVQPEKILDIHPDAGLLPPDDFRKVGDLIDEMSRDFSGNNFREIKDEAKPEKADAIIPIATGCNGHCTYCITRLARGDLKSTSPEEILYNTRKALKRGYKELRITSQDNALYGRDISYSLPGLLNEIVGLKDDFRIRVGMMNPNNIVSIADELLDVYSNDNIYKFFHLPVQSGDDGILKKMGREYDVDSFLDTVGKYRRSFPNLTLSTDVITGFPGEGEDEFQKTLELVERVRPDILNITRFSSRPGTQAEKMDDRIPSRIAKDRSRILTKIHERISLDINRAHIGKSGKVLITKHGKNDTMFGRDGNYKPVILKEKLRIGDFVEVRILDATAIHLIGKSV
jgi:MiaB-like tRNA modifying enzyme